MKDLWILGGEFLRDTYKALPALNRKNTRIKSSGPYIVDQFNVTPLMYQKNGNFLARYVNNFIEGLNELHKIPRILLVIPDKEFIKGAKHEEYGISKIMGSCLKHLMSQIDVALERKKQSMEIIKPGSITYGEPKQIWVKMIDRSLKGSNKTKSKQREKFIAILEEELAARKHCYILDVKNGIDEGCFDRYGFMTPRGMEAMWLEIDMQLRKFDKQELSLKPSPIITNANAEKERAKKSDKKHQTVNIQPVRQQLDRESDMQARGRTNSTICDVQRRLLPPPPPKYNHFKGYYNKRAKYSLWNTACNRSHQYRQ